MKINKKIIKTIFYIFLILNVISNNFIVLAQGLPIPTQTPTLAPQPRFIQKPTPNKIVEKTENLLIDLSGEEDSTIIKLEDFNHQDVAITTRIKDLNGKFLEVEKPKNFRPGKYFLKITDNQGQTSEQEFYWGVLAINTNKSIYLPNETVFLQMTTLNEYGHTLCNTNLSLEIINPQSEIINPNIENSDTCGANNVTDNPDYFAKYKADTVGTYQIKLKNLDNSFEINDSFEVRESLPFEIERIGATRINPFKSDYTMTLKIKANQDYQGEVEETIPKSFTVNQPVSWTVDWKNGEIYTLSYEYSAPKISPQIFLLGPLKIADFEETRQWQIASDAACNSAATGNWATAGTWAAPCNIAGGPTSADAVTILAGHVVTVGANAAAASIVINSPTTANGLTISSTFTLNVTGNVTFNQNVTALNQTISLAGSGILNVGGNLNMGNVPTGAGSALVVTAAGTCTSCRLNVTGSVNMTNATTAVAGSAKITMTTGATNVFSAGSLSMTGNTTGTGITTVSTATGTITVNGATTFAGVAAKTLLNVTGAGILNLSGNLGASGTVTLAATSTTNTNASLSINGAYIFGNFTIASGTTTLGAAITIAGNWTNNSGASALAGAFTVTKSGTTKTIGGSASTTFNALTLAAASTTTANTSFTVTNGLIFTAGGAQSLTLGSSSVIATLNTVTHNQPTSAVTSAFNINAGTANLSGTYTFVGTNTGAFLSKIVITTGTLNLNAATSLAFAANTTLSDQVIDISGGAGTVFIAGSIINSANATITPGTTSTWNFDGTSAQIIPMGTTNTRWGACTTQCYAKLVVMNTSGATLGNNVASGNISDNLTVGDGTVAAIFKNGGFAIVGVAGKTFSVLNNSVFEMSSSSVYPTGFGTFTYGSTSTVRYLQTLTNTVIAVATYGNLELKPSANTITFNFAAGSPIIAGSLTTGVNGAFTGAIISANANSTILDVGGTVTIGANSTLVAHATNSFTVAGNWTNNGIFTNSNGTVTFDGVDSSTQVFTGNTTFRNFTATTSSNTVGRTLQFIGTSATTVTGTWILTGFSGKVITLQSSNASAWTINPAAANVTYVSVSRSTNTGVSFCSTFSTDGLNNTGWTISSGASCISNQAPNSPTSLLQKKTDDSVITTGSWINATSVKFTATASDPDASDTVQICVEKDILGTSFSNTEDSCGTGVAYSGTPVAVNITISGITDANEYHWQARIKDTNGAYSTWVSYDVNAESARDFGIDTTAPTGGTVYDGTSAGVDSSFNNGSLSTLSANWSGFNSNASGLNSYDYSIGTTVGGTDVKTWTGNGTATSVTVSGLTLQTSQIYYFNIRANDNAGNSNIISSNGQLVQPSLSFSLSSSSISFSNLNAGNSFSDTKTTTLTTSTNAYNGYAIRAYKTDNLRSTIYPSTYIPDFSGSYSAPSAWIAGNYGFGYSSSDNSIQGASKFPLSGACLGGGTAPCYAPFSSSAPGDIVADHTSTVTGTSVSNEQFTMTYKVATANVQVAGPYSTTIIYTITAQY